MTTNGTPTTDTATRIMLLGSGELGREVAIELIRYAVKLSPWIATPMPLPCR